MEDGLVGVVGDIGGDVDGLVGHAVCETESDGEGDAALAEDAGREFWINLAFCDFHCQEQGSDGRVATAAPSHELHV